MKVLLDVGISPRLRSILSDALDGTFVESAVFHDWRTLRNDEILRRASELGFTTLVTADKRLAREQAPLPIAVIAVEDNRLTALKATLAQIAAAVRETPVGSDRLVAAPADPQADTGA